MLTALLVSMLLVTGSGDDECERLAKQVESLTAQVSQLQAENAALRSQIEQAANEQLDAEAVLKKVATQYRSFESYADEGEITLETDGRKYPRAFTLHFAKTRGFRFEFAQGRFDHYLLQFDSDGLSLLANDMALLLNWDSMPDLLESTFRGYQDLVNKSVPFVPVLLNKENALGDDFFAFGNLQRLDDAMVDDISCIRVRGVLRNTWPESQRTSTLWIDASNWTIVRVVEEITAKEESSVVTMNANPRVNPSNEDLRFDFDPPARVPVLDERSR